MGGGEGVAGLGEAGGGMLGGGETAIQDPSEWDSHFGVGRMSVWEERGVRVGEAREAGYHLASPIHSLQRDHER